MAVERALLVQLVNKINRGRIVLPSLPEVAMAVRDLSQRDDCSAEQLVEEISKDPGLATTLISMANSEGFGGELKANSVQFAVTRLGLERTRDLAAAAAMHQLFYSEQSMIWDKLEQLRRSNIEVASCALAVLACEHEQGRLINLSAETLLLACQIHNIGVLPLVDQAEKHPHLFRDGQQLEQIIKQLGAPLGQAVLQQWRFPEELVVVARYWADLSYQTSTPSYLDLVRLGALYSRQLLLDEPLPNSLQLLVDKGVLSGLEVFGRETYFLTFNAVHNRLSQHELPLSVTGVPSGDC
ncbi:HDOD domain-containing protein [Ferrimonas senticii]|uniref:HDOD domain-containing protein n=1 Tax=Ferrimonas senticii TaxID=394566 RepID=UPI00041BE5B2|nr:HDOD domain-containing protein [Ferrimonas senticii]